MKKYIAIIVLGIVVIGSFILYFSMFRSNKNPFFKLNDVGSIRGYIESKPEEKRILACDVNCPDYDPIKRKEVLRVFLNSIFVNDGIRNEINDIWIFEDDIVLESQVVKNSILGEGKYLLFILGSPDSSIYHRYYYNYEKVQTINDSVFVCYTPTDVYSF